MRPFRNRRRKCTSALDSTTTRTHSIDVTRHSCHQLMILYRKHYDGLTFYVIVIKVSFFFHWAGKQIFVLLYFYYFHHESDGSKEKNTIGVQEA
jgi:hypothetical protein